MVFKKSTFHAFCPIHDKWSKTSGDLSVRLMGMVLNNSTNLDQEGTRVTRIKGYWYVVASWKASRRTSMCSIAMYRTWSRPASRLVPSLTFSCACAAPAHPCARGIPFILNIKKPGAFQARPKVRSDSVDQSTGWSTIGVYDNGIRKMFKATQ